MNDYQAQMLVIQTILGASLCLGGWVIVWAGTRLFGIVIGLGLGFVFGELLSLVLNLAPDQHQLTLLACSLLGAVAGIFLARIVTAGAFAVIGLLFGALLGRIGSEVFFVVTDSQFEWTRSVMGVVAVCAAVFALLAVFLQRFIIIVVTSYVGAAFLTGAFPALREHLVWWFLAFFTGAIVWQTLFVTKLASNKKAEG
ncbi:MAG: hypothetical protein N2111_11775 [Candidatus Sumerlaeaceae bacterium]|nr:hypothetical protein [Candidatus Sumerlaeaceae bacterium]